MAFAVSGDARVFATTAETRVSVVDSDDFRGTGYLPSNVFPVVFPFRLG